MKPYNIIVLIVWWIFLFVYWEQSRRLNPTIFHPPNCQKVKIINWEKGESIYFSIIDMKSSDTLYQLVGSTDLICDAPSLKLWDVNNDGTKDLYFEECGGHGFLKCDTDKFQFVKLADGNRDFVNYWFKVLFFQKYKIIVLLSIFVVSGILILSLGNDFRTATKKD